jgi:hypothetical protein
MKINRNIRNLIEQIEHEVAPSDVRELVRQSSSKVVLAKIARQEILGQKNNRLQEPNGRGSRDVGRPKQRSYRKGKGSPAPLCKPREAQRDFLFIGALSNSICAMNDPSQPRGSVKEQ